MFCKHELYSEMKSKRLFKAKLGPVSLFLDLTFTTQIDYKTFCLLLSIENLLSMFIQSFQNLFVLTAILEHNLLNCWTFLASKELFLLCKLLAFSFIFIYRWLLLYFLNFDEIKTNISITKKCKQTKTLFPRHCFRF